EEADGVSVEMRNAIMQIEDPVERVTRLERLAKLEIQRQRLVSAERTLDAAWASTSEVPTPSSRSSLVRHLAQLAVHVSASAAGDAREQVLSIPDSNTRVQVLQELIQAGLAHWPVDSTIGAVLREPPSPERSQRLLELARERLLAGFSGPAIV